MASIDETATNRTDLRSWQETASRDDIERRAHQLRERLGFPQIVLLDNSSNIETLTTLLNAYEQLLSVGDLDPATTVLVLDTRSSRERQRAVAKLSSRFTNTNRRFDLEGHATVVAVNTTSEHGRAALHRASNVYLALSHTQPFDGAPAEYVACRVAGYGAILATVRAAQAHLLDGAVVVDRADTASLAAGLRAAARLTHDQSAERMTRLRAAVSRRSPVGARLTVRRDHAWETPTGPHEPGR